MQKIDTEQATATGGSVRLKYTSSSLQPSLSLLYAVAVCKQPLQHQHCLSQQISSLFLSLPSLSYLPRTRFGGDLPFRSEGETKPSLTSV